MPNSLRIHARFDRKLLGKLSSCAWNCIKADRDSLLVAWQEAVFALYLAEGKIEPEVVEKLLNP